MSLYRVESDEQNKLDRLFDDVTGSSVLINRFGGEAIGYRWKNEVTGEVLGLLYRDHETEPPADGWKNRATILFPLVGGLKNKQSKIGDRIISTRGNHGFVRHSTFDLAETDTSNSAKLIYRMVPNDEIRGYYPFDFVLEVTYELKDGILSVQFDVTNPGSEDIWYCIGWHPGFKAPLINGKGSKADCSLLIPGDTITRWENNEHCRLTGNTNPEDVSGGIKWTEEELEATMMYGVDNPEQRKVTLRDPAAGVDVTVEFEDFPHLGFWSEPGYEFICIEPWQGMDDHEEQETFDKKPGVVCLAPGKKETYRARIVPSAIK